MLIPLLTDKCLISTYSPLDNQLTLGNLIGNKKQKWFCPHTTTRNKKQIQYSLKSALGMYEGTLLDQKCRKSLLMKVASKLRLGEDLSLKALPLPTKFKAIFSLMYELPFAFINMDCGALFPWWRKS